MMPEWRRRLAQRPPMADWYRRRHHCYDVVIGQLRDVDKRNDTVQHSRPIQSDTTERTTP